MEKLHQGFKKGTRQAPEISPDFEGRQEVSQLQAKKVRRCRMSNTPFLTLIYFR